MVITCPECTTKFRVKTERIPAKGAKVRCARCKHIFHAQQPAAEAEIIETPVAPAAVPQPDPKLDLSSIETSAPADPAQLPGDEQLTDSSTDDSSFSYEQFHALDKTGQDEDFAFSSAENSLSSPAGEAPAEPVKTQTPEEILDFIFSDSETETASGPADSGEPAGEPPVAEFGAGAESPAEIEPSLEIATPEKKGAFSSLIRLLLLLVLGLLILGGVLIYMNGPESVQQTLQQLLGQNTPQSMRSGQIVLDQLEGKFINNQLAGELFVIRGEATNLFDNARAAIQVKGVIFDKDGKPLLQKTIFCGNPITDQELQTLPFERLEEMMGNQFGKALSNMKVAIKQKIPFVIAFRDLPRTLSEFSVDVTSSEPAAD